VRCNSMESCVWPKAGNPAKESNSLSIFHPILRRTAVAASLAMSFALVGCGGDDSYFKINGQVVTKDEYLRKLERQQLSLPNGMSVGVQQYVLDQLVSNRVMQAEAAKMGVSPTEDQINLLYNAQKDLYENRTPGKTYTQYLAKQGVTAEEVREDMRGQLAEVQCLRQVDEHYRGRCAQGVRSGKGLVGLAAPHPNAHDLGSAEVSAHRQDCDRGQGSRRRCQEVRECGGRTQRNSRAQVGARAAGGSQQPGPGRHFRPGAGSSANSRHSNFPPTKVWRRSGSVWSNSGLCFRKMPNTATAS